MQSGVFKALDKDGSGSLTLQEIKQFMGATTIKMDDDMFKEVFAELDEDRSNEISEEELGQFLRKLFVCQREEIGRVIGRSQW